MIPYPNYTGTTSHDDDYTSYTATGTSIIIGTNYGYMDWTYRDVPIKPMKTYLKFILKVPKRNNAKRTCIKRPTTVARACRT